MIQIYANINPDIYCYDTGLNFGYEVGQELLAEILKDESQFVRRNNYYRNHDHKELIRQIGVPKTREIIRRKEQVQRDYPNQKLIDFKQLFFTDVFKEKLLATLPSWLKISDTEPDCMLQIGIDGHVLPPHKGHHRTCSLFMLLQADKQETRWYRQTEDFETIDALRIPDLNKIEMVVSAVMETGRWYMFNNKEWHSVHKYVQGKKRISMGLDFHSIEGLGLVELIKKNT